MADKLSYVNYNFSDLVNELTNRLRVKDTWKDAYVSSTGQTLIELYSYVANMILYNLERRFEECFIATAKNKSSVINLVQLLNYKPKRKTSAIGYVQFTSSTAPLGSQGTSIVIPKNTVISNSSGIEFITTQDASITSGNLSVDNVQVIQGKLYNETYESTGAENQEYTINNTSVENDVNIKNFKVYTKSILSNSIVSVGWEQVDTFLYSDPNSLHYVLRNNYDDTVTILFGNNVNGKIPTANETVYIEYLVSDGLAGNVYDLNSVTTMQNPTVDYEYWDNNYQYKTSITLSVTNTSAIIGGDDAEGIEEIRIEAPKVFKTGDRLVTKEDYQSIILNMAGIADVNVWGENEVTNPEWDMMNTVKICAINQNWEPFLDSTAFSDALKEKSMLTVKYDIVEVEQLLLVPLIKIYVNKGYGLAETLDKVTTVFVENFILGDTVKIGEAKRVSNLVQAVEELAEIAYIHLTLEIRHTLDYDSTIGYYGTLLSTSIKPNSVRLMNGTTQIAIDVEGESSTGDFSGAGVVGTIDYDTGYVEITEFPLDSDNLFVYYQQDNDGDIIVDNYQICNFSALNVSLLQYKV